MTKPDRIKQQWEHFWRAIPDPREAALSANQIFNRQEIYRLPRAQVYAALEGEGRSGKLEVVSVGYMQYYRKKATTQGGIATPAEPSYNDSTRSKSPPEKADGFFRVLTPLSTGKSVALWMDDPRRGNRKNIENRKKLVVLIPGPIVGLPQGTVVVCVIGSGSCIVRVDQPTKVADLVLAGIPAKLAASLMNVVYRVMKQVKE